MTCILVTGIGASGTSVVAGCLHKLGVQMGHPAHLGVHPGGFDLYEDSEFYGLFNSPDPAILLPVVRAHMRAGTWGWKNTLTHKAFPWLLSSLQRTGEEVKVVAVHRTLCASIRGRMKGRCPPGAYYTRESAERWAVKALAQYASALQIAYHFVPIHHISFEFLCADPRSEVERLAQFAGVDVTEKAISSVRT